MREEVKESMVEKLSWQVAERDDKKVAKDIFNKELIDGIYELDGNGLLDRFYGFLKEKEVMELLEKINPEGIKRVMVPFTQYVLLYLLKILFGIKAMSSTPELLFSDEGAMQLVGFNAHQIKSGNSERGEWKRKKKEKSGPLCDDTLARNIIKIPLEEIAKFFNGVIRCLAKSGMFSSKISISIDSTDIRTTWKWLGCGSVTRKKRVRGKDGRINEIEITVYGWKIISAFYSNLKIPLSIKVVPINEHESKYTREIILQAIKNLEGYTKISRVSIDRGFLDGADLWWLNEQKMEFVVPVKSGMDIKEDAMSLAKLGETSNKYEMSRKKKIIKGVGKKAHEIEIETKLVGIEGLTSLETYGVEGFKKEANKKEGRVHPINAIVVLKWDGKEPKKENTVYVTNMDVKDPFNAFDTYDDRSIIENSLWKEGKGGWFLKHAPAKTQRALEVHVFFTLAVLALTNAYREWERREEEQEEKEVKEDIFEFGIKRWRERNKKESRDQAIVFVKDSYGIFYLSEIMVLGGFQVKDLPKGISGIGEIFERYDIMPP